jgi:hypothetical protein
MVPPAGRPRGRLAPSTHSRSSSSSGRCRSLASLRRAHSSPRASFPPSLGEQFAPCAKRASPRKRRSSSLMTAPQSRSTLGSLRRPGSRSSATAPRTAYRIANSRGISMSGAGRASATSRDSQSFRSWRDTGITWLALAGVDGAKMQRRAGHDDIKTTIGYVKTAEDVSGSIGEPFPPPPACLVSPDAIDVTKAADWTRD